MTAFMLASDRIKANPPGFSIGASLSGANRRTHTAVPAAGRQGGCRPMNSSSHPRLSGGYTANLEEARMHRLNLFCGAAALSALTLMPAVALAQEGGPCTDDIAKLRRDMDTQVGMGAPTPEPDYGQRKGPENASSQQTASAKGDNVKPVGTPDTDRAQKAAASRESG